MKIISERLKELRRLENKTQAEVALALGIFDSSYRAYEIGRRVPAAEKLVALADYFGVSVDYLLGRTDNLEINK